MIPVFSGYFATACGNVYSSKTDKFLTGAVDKDGYIRLSLRHDGLHKNYRRARLICSAFHGTPDDGYQVNHKNGVKGDDRPSNLEWVSPSQNAYHAINKLQNWPNIKLSEDEAIEIRESNLDAKDLACKFGISRSTVYQIRRGDRRACAI